MSVEGDWDPDEDKASECGPDAQHRRSLADAKHVAIRLLASREHGRSELAKKLCQRGWSATELEPLLDELSELDLQSDLRFAQSHVRVRSAKAYGPLRIRAELQERGIDRGLIEQALQTEAPDWLALASRWYERRYGDEPVEGIKDKSKRQNALARRGFTTDVIRELLN